MKITQFFISLNILKDIIPCNTILGIFNVFRYDKYDNNRTKDGNKWNYNTTKSLYFMRSGTTLTLSRL